MTILCRSFNGWPVSRDKAEIGVVAWRVPGIDRTWWTLEVAQPVFARIVRRWNTEVDPIEGGTFDDWSYNVRPARTQATTDPPRSNHGSATAIDVDSAQFPAKVRRMTAQQRAAALAIEAEFGGLIVWGGRWSGDNVDEMHWELAPGTTRAQVRAKIAELRLRPDGTRAIEPTGLSPLPVVHWEDLKNGSLTQNKLVQASFNRLPGTRWSTKVSGRFADTKAKLLLFRIATGSLTMRAALEKLTARTHRRWRAG